MIGGQDFRDAMAHMAGAVNVVTAQGRSGPVGCTVSAACSVTDEPPTLLVCISRASRSHASFVESRSLCVNVLSAAQQPVARRFADSTATPQERFAMAQWDTLATGAPALRDALASFDCEISGSMEVGTHTVFSCSVRAVRINTYGDGLVYFSRAYHRLTLAESALG